MLWALALLSAPVAPWAAPWAATSSAATPSAADLAAAPLHRVPDTMAQRLLACSSCHGPQGAATRDGYLPRIAGKPAGYLYHQLLNFRDGRRHNAAMGRLVQHLSPAYLREIAEHFAALDLPYAAPPRIAATLAQLQRGQQLAQHGDAALRVPACAACHGAALIGQGPSIPGLLGLPRDYLLAQLGAWRTGLRRAHAPDCMAQISQALSHDDLSAVASYLALQAMPPKTATFGPMGAPDLPPHLPLTCGSELR